MKAPGKPTMITFFPAQYSATFTVLGPGNVASKISTDGILDGAAKARGAPKPPAVTDATMEEIQRDANSFIIEDYVA